MAGKPILAIVGSGPGVSFSVAKRFGREGFRVALIARSAEKLGPLASQLSKSGVEVATFAADAAKESSLVAAFSKLKSTWGNPTVLLYNAASVSFGEPSNLSAEQLLNDLKVGVVGAVIAIQQVAPGMRAQGQGTMLLTGGGFALQPMLGLFSLGLEKAAIRNLTQSLAQEFAPDGIKVGTVTICGTVTDTGPFAADLIAEEFFNIHTDPVGSPVERMFTGTTSA